MRQPKDGIVVIDVDRESVQDVNPYFLELTGYSRDAFVGRPIVDAGRLLGVPEVGTVIEATRPAEVVRYDDLQLTRRDRRQMSVEAVGNRYDVGGQSVIQFNVRDISARKESEKALKSSEERFRMVVESLRDYAIFQPDANGNIATWNRGAERVLGWSEQEALGQSGVMVFTPEDRERVSLTVSWKQHSRKDERWTSGGMFGKTEADSSRAVF